MEKKYLSRDIVGKQVIDPNALIIGTVKDTSFDMDSKNIAIIVTTKASTEIVIEGDNVNVIGDVVLLNQPVELPTSPETKESATPPATPTEPSTEPGLCHVCGYQNKADSNFCIKCGAKLK